MNYTLRLGNIIDVNVLSYNYQNIIIGYKDDNYMYLNIKYGYINFFHKYSLYAGGIVKVYGAIDD